HVARCAEVESAVLFGVEPHVSFAGDDHDEGAICVPLRGSNGQLLGYLGLRPRGDLASAQIEIIEPLLATAARLLESQRDRRRREEAEADRRLLATLASEVRAAPDLNAALEVVLRAVVERTGWDLGQAWTRRLDTDRLECAPAWFT